MSEKVGTEKIEAPAGHLVCIKADGYVYAIPRKGGAAKKISKTAIKKEPGYLYYVKDGYVQRSKMKNAKK